MARQLKILIVDDNTADYNLIRRRVESGLKGYAHVSTTHSSDSQDCMATLSRGDFNCIILDYLLGAENGIDVLKKISAAQCQIPVIVLTGEGDEQIAVAAMKMGAADYLVKKDTTSEGIALAVISALEKFELQISLRDKKRELEDFAYTAAHDIKSPLATINQTAQLLSLRAAELDDQEVSTYAETLQEVSRSISDFVTELLSYAKMGRLERKFETVDLGGCVQRAITNLSTLIESSEATVTIHNELPTVKGDALALMQFFQNVIANAIKFRRKGVKPIIKILKKDLDDSESSFDYKFCIVDNGIGIAPENHKRIFSPLVRLGNNDEFEGSGLGLAIAKKIVEQHRGELWIESSLGEGTTICLLLKKDPEQDQSYRL